MSSNNNNETNSSDLKKYSDCYSREKRVIIPLINYKPFHKVSDVDNDNPNYINRPGTTQRLKSWLNDNDANSSGSYLITGYRGMGKSSFVGQIVNSIIKEEKDSQWLWKDRTLHYIVYAFTYVMILVLPWVIYSIFTLRSLFIRFNVATLFICFNVATLLAAAIVMALLCLFLSVYCKNHKTNAYIHYIKINIGNEIRNERDVLAILSSSIADKIREYVKSQLLFRRSYFLIFAIKLFCFSVGSVFIFSAFKGVINELTMQPFKNLHSSFVVELISAICNVFFIAKDSWLPIFVILFLSILFSYILFFKLFEPIYFSILRLFSVSSKNPHYYVRSLDSLVDRINCSMDVNITPEVPASSIFSLNIGNRKSKKYQQASVREIEYELSKIINEIQKSRLMNNRFIIVLDELDKLDVSATEFKDAKKDEDISPSFSYDEMSSEASVNHQDRQHHILMFLGRLKYFTSNANAKFIFMAGHELYDAYLADVSDREYSISSMFNGVLNLNSFLSSKPQYKNVTRMSEAFLCKALVNLELYKSSNDKELIIANLEKIKNNNESSGIETIKKIIDDLEKIKDNIKSSGDIETIKKIIDDLEKIKNIIELLGKIEKKIEKIKKDVYDGGDDTIYTLQNVAEEFHTQYYSNFHSYTREQWESVFRLLQQFVTYLTFTSNGAPKKLANQFEKYVISKADYDRLREHTNDVGDYIFFFGENLDEANYYLSFGYPDKEKIGFIHYIAQPVFNNIINHNSDYDDKLLVTSLFLVSHLYKHHGSGFSWRNLEYIPELIVSNKTPELRGYIKDILIMMEKMDLTSITSGIYTFKFSKSLIEEISHFSRKSEEVSAIFNFSLDYFRDVKVYFQKILSFYSGKRVDGNENSYVSTEVVANIYNYLGDIQMAGEEYTEAASNFRMAADLFKKVIKNNEDSNSDVSLLIMRYTFAMLKLGLAYEKRSTFDSAYLVYNSLTNSLIQYRDVPIEYFGLKSCAVYDRNPEMDVDNIFMYKPHQSSDTACLSNKHKFLPEIRGEGDTNDFHLWVYGSEMFENLYYHLTPEKEQILSKLTAYEDLRVAYLSILTKLFALEKQKMSGITRENVELSVSEFELMYMLTKIAAKHLLSADFYRKLGDILYYKNKSYCKARSWSDVLLLCASGFQIWNILRDFMLCHKFNKSQFEEIKQWFFTDESQFDSNSNFGQNKDNIREAFSNQLINKLNSIGLDDFSNKVDFCSHLDEKLSSDGVDPKCIKRNLEPDKICNNTLGRPCVACMLYTNSLSSLMKIMLPKEPKYKSKALGFIFALQKGEVKSITVNDLRQTALTLEAMGNTMLSCANKDEQVDFSYLATVLNGDTDSKESDISYLDKAILYNIAAGRYYEKANEYTSMAECLHKVMQILYNYLIHTNRIPSDESILIALKNELNRTLRMIYESKSHDNVLDISKFRQVVNSLEKKENSFIMLGFTSMMAELDDLIWDYYRIQLKMLQTKTEELQKVINALYNAPSLRCYNNDSLVSNRVNDLIFKSDLNDMVYEKAFEKENSNDSNFLIGMMINTLKLEEHWSDITPEYKLKIFLIADSIFCLTSVISLLSTIRSNTMFSNISFVDIYLNLIKWVRRKEEIEKAENNDSVKLCLDYQLRLLIPDTSLETIKRSYYLKMAENYFTQALQIHTEGTAYHNMIDRFYIINDDLQNNTSQFMLALERYSLRTQYYEKKLDKENNKYEQKKHDIYKFEQYLTNSNC